MNFFGPSKFDQMLALLREDRAAATAQNAATVALMVKLVDNVTVQAELAKRQLDALMAPQDPPRVRIMTPKHEAELERVREASAPPSMKSLATDTLLRDLESDFRDMKATFA